MEKIAGIFSILLSGHVWRWVSWFDLSTFSRYLHEGDAEPNESSNSATDVEALSKSNEHNGFPHIFTASFDAVFHLTMLFSVDWVNAPEFIPSSVVYYPAADSQFDFPAMKSSEKTSKYPKFTI